MARIEVQLTHESAEWASVVYVMHPVRGCLESFRYEYDADVDGSKKTARAGASTRFLESVKAKPACRWYNDLTGDSG